MLAGADHHGRPFAVVDKHDARIYVFEANGRLAGASAVLLGLTPGDFSVGIDRAPASLTLAERTTPAGRFDARPGRNDKGEDIVWIDYAASLAIHRLRPAPLQERRPARLASPSPEDNRISAGCVVVPVAFVGLMMFVASLGTTEQGSAGAGWAIMMPMSMLGGGMVPLAVMPGWMQSLSVISPVRWMIVSYEGAIWRGFSLAEMALPCAILLAIGAVAFGLGARRFQATLA